MSNLAHIVRFYVLSSIDAPESAVEAAIREAADPDRGYFHERLRAQLRLHADLGPVERVVTRIADALGVPAGCQTSDTTLDRPSERL
jgi:hypothetical protein